MMTITPPVDPNPDWIANPITLMDASSVMVINISDNLTRISFFDIVKRKYRLIGSTTSRTTSGNPFQDVRTGVLLAVKALQDSINRQLIDEQQNIIQPSTNNGTGVDQILITISAGPPLKIMIAGLLADVSVSSAYHLARTTYCGKILHFDLSSISSLENQFDKIITAKPDLIIIAGGTDQGASKAVLQLLDEVMTLCLLLPRDERPQILFVANQELQPIIKAQTNKGILIHFADNVRPVFDRENLHSGQAVLSRITSNFRKRQINGLQELSNWSQGEMITSVTALSRVVRLISKARTPEKGVMGIDVGTAATTVAAAIKGESITGVFPELGFVNNQSLLFETSVFQQITQWLPFQISDNYVKAYLLNKRIRPYTLPNSKEDLAIEQAMARVLIQTAVTRTLQMYPGLNREANERSLPPFEPILVAGDLLTQSLDISQILQILLDGLQPHGATTFVLDTHHTAEAIGACAEFNPILVVQVLDSNAFIHLGTVISLVGKAKPGTPILRATLVDEDDFTVNIEIKYGSIDWIPLEQGKSAVLHLRPLQKFDVGMGGPGIGGKIKVRGGAQGVVIDGRGRPVALPTGNQERYETLTQWQDSLKGKL